MLDLLAMWKSPKMIALMLFTAVLYAALLFPFQGFALFNGHVDFGRVGLGVPVAFSFLFGSAGAWGLAIGNVIYDAVTFQVNAASIFGFIGNLLIGYIPYKLWKVVTVEKPDLRSLKKLGLFAGSVLLACSLCGVVIGWGLDWLGITSFMPTALVIALTDALWAIVVGSIVLALSYGYVSKSKLLYTNILNIMETRTGWSKARSFAILAFVVSIALCFFVGAYFSLSAFALLPFVAVSLVTIVYACT